MPPSGHDEATIERLGAATTSTAGTDPSRHRGALDEVAEADVLIAHEARKSDVEGLALITPALGHRGHLPWCQLVIVW